MGFLAWLKRRSAQHISRRVVADDQHIALIDNTTGANVWDIKWTEINEIVAWKRDVLAYDIICVGFSKQDGSLYWCEEQDEGWSDLLAIMSPTLGIRSSDLWQGVALPAFEANWTVLWKSTGSPLTGG